MNPGAPSCGTPAVFLDRDGVVNKFPGPGKYVLSWSEFELLPGVPEALRRLRKAGFALILVTNQSGVGRGLMRLADLQHIHERLRQTLGAAAFDAVYYCPHHPDDYCRCRKPSPEMILQAARERKLDLAKSFVVGDSGRDIEMGKAAGCRTVFCRQSLPNPEEMPEKYRPDAFACNLSEATDWILAQA
jgi:histidinol-phosphate phosphatase family protein